MVLDILKFPPERKNEACGMCHSAIRDNLPKVEAFVKFIETHYEKEIKDFDAFRYYAFGFFFIAAVFIVFYVRQRIVKPVRKLKDAAGKIQTGNFDVRVDVKGSDDIGVLGSAFNSMSQTLGVTFNENITLIKRLGVLYEISDDIIAELKIEALFQKIADRARELLGCRYSALCLFKEQGEELYE